MVFLGWRSNRQRSNRTGMRSVIPRRNAALLLRWPHMIGWIPVGETIRIHYRKEHRHISGGQRSNVDHQLKNTHAQTQTKQYNTQQNSEAQAQPTYKAAQRSVSGVSEKLHRVSRSLRTYSLFGSGPEGRILPLTGCDAAAA